jgi:hypothetical protein
VYLEASNCRGIVREDGIKLNLLLVEVKIVVYTLSLNVQNSLLRVISKFKSQLLGERLVTVRSEEDVKSRSLLGQ